MTVDAEARNGFITLTGTAGWHYQRDEAEFLAASVPGVLAVANDITLTSKPDGRDIKTDISRAFRRSARLDADELSVETTSYGMVVLAGTVNSWAEHDEAVAAAWSAPGVTEVDDQIVVEYLTLDRVRASDHPAELPGGERTRPAHGGDGRAACAWRCQASGTPSSGDTRPYCC